MSAMSVQPFRNVPPEFAKAEPRSIAMTRTHAQPIGVIHSRVAITSPLPMAPVSMMGTLVRKMCAQTATVRISRMHRHAMTTINARSMTPAKTKPAPSHFQKSATTATRVRLMDVSRQKDASSNQIHFPMMEPVFRVLKMAMPAQMTSAKAPCARMCRFQAATSSSATSHIPGWFFCGRMIECFCYEYRVRTIKTCCKRSSERARTHESSYKFSDWRTGQVFCGGEIDRRAEEGFGYRKDKLNADRGDRRRIEYACRGPRLQRNHDQTPHARNLHG